MRPRGIPPIPSARSSARAPVGMIETPWPMGCSPSRMTAPFPYCRSICESVTSSIFSRSIPGTSSTHRAPALVHDPRRPFPATRMGGTVEIGSDINYTPVLLESNGRDTTRTDVRSQRPSQRNPAHSSPGERPAEALSHQPEAFESLVGRAARRKVALVQDEGVDVELPRGNAQPHQV